MQRTYSPTELPKNWVKIVVDLDKYEIVTREYKEEESDEIPSVYSSIASIGANHSEEIRVASYLRYFHEFPDGRKVKFLSNPVYEDETNLRFRLMNIPQLFIYADPNNLNNYRFRI